MFKFFSDEEEEDLESLVYLPVTLEIDENELEVDGPTSLTPVPETSAKSKRLKTVEIDLKEAPKDGKFNSGDCLRLCFYGFVYCF